MAGPSPSGYSKFQVMFSAFSRAPSIRHFTAWRGVAGSRPNGVYRRTIAARSFTNSPRAGKSNWKWNNIPGGNSPSPSLRSWKLLSEETMFSDLLFRFRSLLHRKNAERELDAELRFHFDHAVEKNMQAGMTREEASRRARIAFGGLEQVKEDCHVAWGTTFVEAFRQDVRFGTRMLVRSPGFSAIALLTLALGIGATTSIFSVVDAVLLRSLPYRDASRLVSLYEDRSSTGFPRKEFTPANYA